MTDNTEPDVAADLARALNAADVDYSGREHRADAGDGDMEPGDWFTFIARAALTWMRENGYEKREPAYTDRNPAPPIHEDGCAEWCAHCALCGVPVLYGARCEKHLGVYPEREPVVVDAATVERAGRKLTELDHTDDWSYGDYDADDFVRMCANDAARVVLTAALALGGKGLPQ